MVKHYIEGMEEEPNEWPSINDIIFNHDFARALFGERRRKSQGFNLMTGEPLTSDELATLPQSPPAWQSRLSEAVVSDDPIGHMYKEVFGEVS
jgi:hypothetical protein